MKYAVARRIARQMAASVLWDQMDQVAAYCEADGLQEPDIRAVLEEYRRLIADLAGARQGKDTQQSYAPCPDLSL